MTVLFLRFKLWGEKHSCSDIKSPVKHFSHVLVSKIIQTNNFRREFLIKILYTINSCSSSQVFTVNTFWSVTCTCTNLLLNLKKKTWEIKKTKQWKQYCLTGFPTLGTSSICSLPGCRGLMKTKMTTKDFSRGGGKIVKGWPIGGSDRSPWGVQPWRGWYHAAGFGNDYADWHHWQWKPWN